MGGWSQDGAMKLHRVETGAGASWIGGAHNKEEMKEFGGDERGNGHTRRYERILQGVWTRDTAIKVRGGRWRKGRTTMAKLE